MRLRTTVFTAIALLIAAVAVRAGPAASEAPAACPGLVYTVVPSPNVPLVRANILNGLAAVAANDVWAVGNTDTGSGIQPLREHWDGSQWTIVAGPSGVGFTNDLKAAAAAASDDVWAVGYILGTPQPITLIQHWDGSAWATVPSPSVPIRASAYLAVDALSRSDAWAVGVAALGSSSSITMTAHWDGTTWSLVASPSPGAVAGLQGVAAVAPNDVWAVGYQGAAGAARTLVEHWDGSAWTVVPSPNVGLDANDLYAVHAISASDVWAVGTYYASPGPLGFYAPLALHWDGAAWTSVPVPVLTPAQDQLLLAVAGACADDVHAAGTIDTGPGGVQSLVARWDGTAWCVDAGPMGGVEGNALNAATWAPGDDVWVAGSSTDLLVSSTLTARTVSAGSPTGAVGNALRATKQGTHVDLDWSAGALVPRRYNVHRETAKTAIAPPASPPLAAVSSSETYFDPGAVADPRPFFLYEVYGRDCAGGSIFN